MRPAVPPLSKPNKDDASSISHVLINVQANPRVEINRKLRCGVLIFEIREVCALRFTHIQLLLPAEDLHILLVLDGTFMFASRRHFIGLEFMVGGPHFRLRSVAHLCLVRVDTDEDLWSWKRVDKKLRTDRSSSESGRTFATGLHNSTCKITLKSTPKVDTPGSCKHSKRVLSPQRINSNWTQSLFLIPEVDTVDKDFLRRWVRENSAASRPPLHLGNAN